MVRLMQWARFETMSLKNFIYLRCERGLFLPWALNAGFHCIQIASSVKERFSVPRFDTSGWHNPTVSSFNDHEVNFFARLLLERKYDFVIEIGAYDLARSKKLKALFPSLNIFALDITPDFKEPKIIDGISIAPYNIAQIKTIASSHERHGLMCSSGTLTFFESHELRSILTTAFSAELDIALVEPCCIRDFPIKWPWKRSSQTVYHNYIGALSSAGYDVSMNDHAKDRWRNITGRAEAWSYIFAGARRA